MLRGSEAEMLRGGEVKMLRGQEAKGPRGQGLRGQEAKRAPHPRNIAPQRAPKTTSERFGSFWSGERRPREFQEVPKELQSHDPLSLSADYELPRSR